MSIFRRKAEERLMDATKEQLACANPAKSEKTLQRMEEIKTEQNKKLNFNKRHYHRIPNNMLVSLDALN